VSASSYDAIPDFGLLYDSVPLYAARQDIAFYVQEAAAVRGPVLELGCGTGRILLPMARAGCTVVGLDNSRQMLACCRAKLAAEPAPVRARVTLHEHDVRDFDLGAKYPLVIAPDWNVWRNIALGDRLPRNVWKCSPMDVCSIVSSAPGEMERRTLF